MFPRVLLCFAVLCFGQSLPGQAKDKDVLKPNEGAGRAPVVYSSAKPVPVLRGQTVEIELTGTSSSAGNMSFIIRNQPKLGKLEGKPVAKTRLSAVVRYTADPALKGDRDEFTFAGQMPGSSTSDPAKITIQITDAAPKIDAQPLLEAGNVVLGHSKTREFRLRNTGNAPWNAKVPAPKGWAWKVPEGGNFQVEPGKELSCEIICEAVTLGGLDETIALTPDTRVRFTARIVPPFTILPKNLTLKWDKGSKSRKGSVEVQNYDNRELNITVTGPEWATAPASQTVAADGKGSVVLTLSGRLTESLEGVWKIAAGTYVQEVHVKAEPAPPVLTVDDGIRENGGVHFGKLTLEQLPSAKIEVSIQNEGGTAAPMTVQLPERFRLQEPLPTEGVPLPPGEKAAFTVLPPNDVQGTHQGMLVVTAGETKLEIECTAGILRVPKTAGEQAGTAISERPTVRGPKTAEQAKKETMGSNKGIYFGVTDPKLPLVDFVDITEYGDGYVVFSWDLPPQGEGWSYELYFAAKSRFKDGTPVKIYEPFGDQMPCRVEGRKGFVKVTGLIPGLYYLFRLQTVAPDGRKSDLGREIKILLHAREPSHWQENWPFYGIGAILLGGAGYWLWKRWKAPISAVS